MSSMEIRGEEGGEEERRERSRRRGGGRRGGSSPPAGDSSLRHCVYVDFSLCCRPPSRALHRRRSVLPPAYMVLLSVSVVSKRIGIWSTASGITFVLHHIMYPTGKDSHQHKMIFNALYM